MLRDDRLVEMIGELQPTGNALIFLVERQWPLKRKVPVTKLIPPVFQNLPRTSSAVLVRRASDNRSCEINGGNGKGRSSGGVDSGKRSKGAGKDKGKSKGKGKESSEKAKGKGKGKSSPKGKGKGKGGDNGKQGSVGGKQK